MHRLIPYFIMDEINATQLEQHTNTFVKNILKQPVSLITDELYLFIMSISLGIICQTICVFGTVSNIINIVVFIKQGFTDNVNISLLALAASDLASILFIMWSNVCFTQIFRDSNIPFVSQEVQLITGSWPHVIFTRTTGWITAFISFERCICVTLPLKVKSLFTRARHIVAMVTIFCVTIGCSSLAYVSLGLDWKSYHDRNTSMVGLVYRMDVESRKLTDSVGYAVSGVFMPITCFVSVLVFTLVLIIKLNQQTAWRQSRTVMVNAILDKSRKNISVNTREQNIAKMIISISIIFIVCYLPAVGIFIAGYLEPQLSYDGVYRNMFLVTLSISFTAEVINSSLNIFVYTGMSTKYRKTFLAMFQFMKK